MEVKKPYNRAEQAREAGKLGGRPLGTVSDETRIRQELRKKLTKLASDHAHELFDAKLDLAKGHFVYVKDGITGEMRVYKKSPDGKSIEWILEQTIGKAKEFVEHSGDITVKDLVIDE